MNNETMITVLIECAKVIKEMAELSRKRGDDDLTEYREGYSDGLLRAAGMLQREK